MKKNLLNKIRPYISINRNVVNGEPLFKGTRIPVSFVVEQLSLGWNLKDIKKRHPELNFYHIRKVVSFLSDEITYLKNDETKKESSWTYSHRCSSTVTL